MTPFPLKKAFVPVAEFNQKVLLLGLVLVGLSACDPSCESTCRKVLKCEDLETNELSVGECTAECSRQSKVFDDAEDDESADALKKHKRCVKSSSCEEILDGACYDDVLYPF